MPPLAEKREAAAYSPGHVTGFFEIRDEDRDVLKRGSRGAGFATDLGARSYVQVEPADAQSIEVALNRAPSEAPVTRAAVRNVLQVAALEGKVGLARGAAKGERAKARVLVQTDLDLPVSQGFGMSAAGALSAALAVARCVGLGRSEAVKAAHAAEIESRTGLGDVAGAAHGGFEIRKSPGLPPWGVVQSFLGYEEVVLCVLGDALETKKVLSDRRQRAAISKAGAAKVDALVQNPTLESFVSLSRDFAEETGLITDELRDACDACREAGIASMVMLGSSVFAFGETRRLEEILSGFGETFVSGVAAQGPRLLEIQR